jgi:hypothetical protein
MPAKRGFSKRLLAELDAAKILGVRSGTEHRVTAVWVVVVEGRVFARSWQDKPTGWYRAFKAEPRGSIEVNGKEVAVRALTVRSQRLRDAVSDAYAQKYDTKASQKWVSGFAQPERSINTVEFIPA